MKPHHRKYLDCIWRVKTVWIVEPWQTEFYHFQLTTLGAKRFPAVHKLIIFRILMRHPFSHEDQ